MGKAKATRPAKTKTVPYDVAEQLRTPEEMAAYLDAWFEQAPDDAAGVKSDPCCKFDDGMRLIRTRSSAA